MNQTTFSRRRDSKNFLPNSPKRQITGKERIWWPKPVWLVSSKCLPYMAWSASSLWLAKVWLLWLAKTQLLLTGLYASVRLQVSTYPESLRPSFPWWNINYPSFFGETWKFVSHYSTYLNSPGLWKSCSTCSCPGGGIHFFSCPSLI